MKREALLRELREAGCEFKRHGKRHDIWANPRTGKSTAVPRHTEIGNTLCEMIRKQLGLLDQDR